ncbi:NUDIX hydrolase [Burkholderia vietnamiensis]|uniref:NUDIX hydrolase n=1 Tax=Burkholderia vietnamiensis TaxID=60552 RepID=UPI0009BD0236|nr:NUDIX domain-containing protein [Burkholderia vietnamiensis]
MRRRRAARLLICNDAGGILLFRFIAMPVTPTQQSYWGTPGGGLDEGESFEQAAVRELLEETGIEVSSVGEEVGRREAVVLLPTGEQVLSEERYFFVRVPNCVISKARWTREERDVTLGYRWWCLADLRNNTEEVRPNNLIEMLENHLKGSS